MHVIERQSRQCLLQQPLSHVRSFASRRRAEGPPPSRLSLLSGNGLDEAKPLKVRRGDEASEEEGSEYKELADVDASAARGAPQAAVMPDGSIVMLSPENPYHSALAIGEPPIEAQPSDAAIQATLALLRPALQLERMARLVRLLAMFDMAFSLMHAVAEIWPAAIAAIMSYCGYLGARTFRRDLSRVYLIYLVLFALARVALSAHFIFSPLPPNTPPSLPMYMALTAIVQLVIAHFVWRFYCMLPRSATEARFVQHIADLQSQHVLTV